MMVLALTLHRIWSFLRREPLPLRWQLVAASDDAFEQRVSQLSARNREILRRRLRPPGESLQAIAVDLGKTVREIRARERRGLDRLEMLEVRWQPQIARRIERQRRHA